jgi:sugar phosphate isomerase/epimerase
MVPGDPSKITEEHCRRLRALGFTGAQVSIPHPGEIDAAPLQQARALLAGHGIRVAQASAAYPALVSADEDVRQEAIRLARGACRGARLLDAVFLLIRSGSLNPAGNYAPHRDNHSAQTAQRLIDSLRQVCAAAESEWVVIGLECHVITTLESPRKVRQIIEGVGSPALRYNADPVNFVSSFADAFDTRRVLAATFQELGDYMVSAHVKDIRLGDRLVVHIDECPIGEGIFDVADFMRRYEAIRPDGYALIEHLRDEHVPAAKAALDAVLAAEGIAWRV